MSRCRKIWFRCCKCHLYSSGTGSRSHIQSANTGNVFTKMPLVIARVDKLKRNKSSQDKKLQEDLKQIDWDLIICDEAHKMSASFSGGVE
ncbi:hypothetical protein ICL16_14525 [Iningainema sp. BLCCT55]|uniref:Helicase/UvrB N-terminal domain-containing protein n=1 Tax=Iningainema tapete BLCC-T55 TaxID=2748662 RepID=A0A8J7CE51_9CYAN|nr:hypothetical protein [Iningainema tapete BLCC-T55]